MRFNSNVSPPISDHAPRITGQKGEPIPKFVHVAPRFISPVTAMSDSPLSAQDARAKLAFREGAWTVKGYADTYRETCAWLPGGGFLACDAASRDPASDDHSHSIFGYSEAEGVYTYVGFHADGTFRVRRGTLQEGVWRLFGQSDRGPAWQRSQVSITPTDEGFRFLEVTSEQGGPWCKKVEIEYVRVK